MVDVTDGDGDSLMIRVVDVSSIIYFTMPSYVTSSVTILITMTILLLGTLYVTSLVTSLIL